MKARRLFLLLAMALAVCAHAAELTATLETGNLRLRRGGPIPLEVRFQNPTPRLLEGRLEVTLLLGDRKAGVHRGAELVLQPGARTIPVLLPPPNAHPGDGIAARLRWLTAEGARDLGTHPIGIYGISGNEVVLGVVRTGRRLTELDHAREASLSVESLRPKLDAAGWIAFTTLTAPVASGGLPMHPSGWCAYDAVFLDGPALAATNEKQLAALARWVEGGGSAGVCTDANLDERHVAFLNRLAAAARPAIHFRLDENGRIARDGGATGDAPALLRPGLGRAVVARDSGASEKYLDGNSWRTAVAWLWKFREDQLREVARTGRWSKDLLRRTQENLSPNYYEDATLLSAVAGFDALTPGAPRQMPLALVLLVLGALFITVGPADWFALGWLRKRRWTWVVFPAVCAAFTWWTVHLASRYLGREDRKGRVRIVDFADDGHVLRELRYELLMPAHDRKWSFDLRDAVAVSLPRIESELDPSTAQLAAIRGWPPMTPGSNVHADPGTDGISDWPSPGHFMLHHALRQWTPAMVRITSFAEQTDAPQPDWEPALRHFNANPNATDWSAGKGNAAAFSFINYRRNDNLEGLPPVLTIRGVDPVEADAPFVQFAAFGHPRVLSGLALAASPALSGTTDLRQPKEWVPGIRTLCAWRRADGELLICRRSFPVK